MPDVIVAQRLTKFYDRRPAVDSLDLCVPQGCVYGFLGCNGSGKSTTIKMLLGMVHPDYGSSQLFGEESGQLRPKTRARIAYLAEGHPLYRWMTVGQAVDFTRPFCPTWDEPLLEQVLDHFQIARRARIRRLSNGQPTRWYDQPATIASINAIEIPEPLVAIFTIPMPYAERAMWKGERSPIRAWIQGLGSAWPQVLLVVLASAAMAAWVHGRQKRLGQPRAAFWAIFVFLGGLPGLAGYLVHRSWPVVEPCPNCREPAPRDREACMHCGQAFPPPARQGIEVFAA